MSVEGCSVVGMHRIEIEGGGAFEMDSREDSLLRGALRAGLAFPYECSVGGCGTCRFDLVAGEMRTLWADAPGLSKRDRQRGKQLACQALPVSDCRIRVRLGAPDAPASPAHRPLRTPARLIARREVSPDMTEFTFHMPQAEGFLPGQYALLHLPGVAGVRAYSMSNATAEGGLWQFIVRRVPGGRGSATLFDRVAVGDSIEVDGPYGHAWLRDTGRDVICVAGGSGLGPMLSIARAVLARPGTRRVHFFLGLRSQDDLGAAREVQPLQGARLDARTVLSAPLPNTPWSGPVGHIHTAVEAFLTATGGDFDHYFAGPPPMVEALQELLVVKHRVPHDRIHFDRFV